MKTFMTLLILITQGLYAQEKLKLYVETTLYFIPKEKAHDIKVVSHMKKYYGGYNEIHSTHQWGLLSGGEWNIETRLNEQNTFNIVFWINDKNHPDINQNFDVSKLEMTTFTLLNNNSGELKINIVPKVIEKKLETVKLSEEIFGLNNLCLKNSAMIIDDNFYIGKLSDFAERFEVRIADFYDIDVSMKPLRDWQQIGTYNDGIIKIDVDDDHVLTVLNVGIGPSGFKKGGPFKVYGAIKPPTHNRKELLKSAAQYDFRTSTERIKRIITKANEENLYSVAGFTTGNDTSASKYVQKAIGSDFIDESCGY